MIRSASTNRYHQLDGRKFRLTKPVHDGMNSAIVGGSAMIAAAKMTGITPAMFTRSGM